MPPCSFSFRERALFNALLVNDSDVTTALQLSGRRAQNPVIFMSANYVPTVFKPLTRQHGGEAMGSGQGFAG